MHPGILFEQPSPFGNIFAVVEDFGKCIYFSLYGPENITPLGEDPERWTPMRSCWVCNTAPVSTAHAFDMGGIMETMNQGTPPPMPAKHCLHADQGLKLNKDELEVVWFEEGDCAALLYQGEIMAVIPPWATPSVSEYVGYAREFKGSPFLGIGSLDEIFAVIEQRIKRAQAFWETWMQPGTWKAFLECRMQILEDKFGKHQRYFSIDGGKFPPKALVVFENEKHFIFITIGMSIFAQPRVELYQENPGNFRRIELGMQLDKQIVDAIGLEKIGQFMSNISSMPWNQLCWLGEGHTLNTDLFKSLKSDQVKLGDHPEASFVLPSYQGDIVKMLWLTAVIPQEQESPQLNRWKSLL